MRALVFASIASAALALSCQHGLDAPRAEAALDEAYFRCKVQPVLAKSCGAFACHGDARRYFHVFARNRLRIANVEKARNATLSDEERAANFEAARAMIDTASLDDSLLLLKPLEQSKGGYFHRGAEIFGGGNVFGDRAEPDFKTLTAWAHGAKEDPTCVEPGSDL